MSWRLPVKLFVRFWQVHAWAGVVTSLLLYMMFLLGAITLFYRPLTLWEEPLRQRPAPEIASLQDVLELAGTLPEEFYVYLPNDGWGLPKIAYFLPGTTKWRAWWVDPGQRSVIPQRELAAAYIYDLHYLWHDVTGYWLQYGGGVLVFGFLLALVTGVVIHLRNLLPQLMRYRPALGRRVLWSDMHKVTGVLGLPFQLVYAITGALMVLSPLLFQLSVGPVFDGDELRAVDTAGALVEEPPARDYGPAARPLALDALVARAAQLNPRLEPESFAFRGYGHEYGTVDVRGEVQGEPFGDGVIRLRAQDGALESMETPHHERAVGSVARWMHGLHTVHYDGVGVRLMLFCLTLSAALAFGAPAG